MKIIQSNANRISILGYRRLHKLVLKISVENEIRNEKVQGNQDRVYLKH